VIAISAALLAGCGATSVSGGSAASEGTHCGTWRWPVKTLSDPAAGEVDFAHVVDIDVRALRAMQPPASLEIDTPRLSGIERQVFRVRAQPVSASIADDHDIHMAVASLSDRSATIIVEFPDIRCSGAASSVRRAQLATARDAVVAACGAIPERGTVTLHGDVTITGVGFFDEVHGQEEVASNGIELHPAMSFTSLKCTTGS